MLYEVITHPLEQRIQNAEAIAQAGRDLRRARDTLHRLQVHLQRRQSLV